MKKIVFDKIQVQNFLSYGNDPVVLEFTNGVNFITGYNKDDDSRNGVGKTSLIVESLSFALFGKTYRKITQKEIRNRKEDATCSVSLWYTVNDEQYRITRSLGPNTLTRHKISDGDTNITKTIAETTKDILDDLGITKEVFENTLVMTAKNSEPFFFQDKSLKTKFIEGILGLECFSELFKDAKDEYNALNADIGKKNASLDTLIKSYESDLSYEREWSDKKELDISRMQDKVQELISIQPVDHSDKIHELQESKDFETAELLLKTDLLNKIKVKEAEYNSNLAHHNSTLTKLTSKPDKCPTCKRAFDDSCQHDMDTEIEEIEGSILSCKLKISDLTSAKSKVQKQIEDIKVKVVQFQKNIDVLNTAQTLFHDASKRIDDLSAKLDELKNSENPFSDKNLKTKESLDLKKTELDKCLSDLRILDGIKIVFSPTGVKATVIEKIMKVFNERFGYYLTKLQTPCVIEFDEFFNESVKSLDGKEISFDSLSEGEKGRVNFALLFAFRDIRRLQSNVDINISVFDELFDSSIDAKASARIMELLQEMSDEHEDCYYIITHNEQNVSIDNANIIYLEKENGITSIKKV